MSFISEILPCNNRSIGLSVVECDVTEVLMTPGGTKLWSNPQEKKMALPVIKTEDEDKVVAAADSFIISDMARNGGNICEFSPNFKGKMYSRHNAIVDTIAAAACNDNAVATENGNNNNSDGASVIKINVECKLCNAAVIADGDGMATHLWEEHCLSQEEYRDMYHIDYLQ